MKIPLLFLGLFLTLFGISQAGPRGGFHGGGGFHGSGFRGQFVARSNGSAFRRGNEIHRGFADRRFSRHNRGIFFPQFGWPLYWDSYTDPLAYSYLEPDSQSDYQYGDNSSAYVRPEPTNRTSPQNPVVVVINTANSRPMDSNANGGYVDNGYISASPAGQQRIVVPDPNQHTAADLITPGDPVVPPATPVPRQNTQTSVQTGTGVFGKFVIVSWLKDGGKDVISVKNLETNVVQRITSQPNIDHFRIVEVHPNPDLRQFEAIISNGSDRGAIRFQF